MNPYRIRRYRWLAGLMLLTTGLLFPSAARAVDTPGQPAAKKSLTADEMLHLRVTVKPEKVRTRPDRDCDDHWHAGRGLPHVPDHPAHRQREERLQRLQVEGGIGHRHLASGVTEQFTNLGQAPAGGQNGAGS